ncbi:hypothetical protein HK096_011553 [Nowakowskiella sp. JEL0078]|nr:hypothetical protein HK096_011553 [Nowakowskiella sp. JEL0078]
MLNPVGQTSSGFDNISQMLHSAASGVRSVSTSIKTVIHLANGWRQADAQWFLTNAFKPGKFQPTDVDVIATSFYPFYNSAATFSSLQQSLAWIASTYNKDVFVAETDFPVQACPNAISEPSIPTTEAGQITWMSRLRGVLSAVGGHAIGFSYWEPTWLQNADLGSHCGSALLFQSNGIARSSISIFGSSNVVTSSSSKTTLTTAKKSTTTGGGGACAVKYAQVCFCIVLE